MVDRQVRCIGRVGPNESERWVAQEFGDVGLGAGDQVVDADDLVAVSEQPAAEVAPDEASSARDGDPHQSSVTRRRFCVERRPTPM